MRTLIDIPTIHDRSEYDHKTFDQAGMGFKLMVGFWANKIWSHIEDEIENRDFRGAKIYAEGLPVNLVSLIARKNDTVGFADIMEASGSRQSRLIGKLVRHGALLMGADSDFLLNTQHRLTNRREAGKKFFNGARLEKHIMEFRDRGIASRINKTLINGENGILILGAGHRVQDFLDKDIQSVPLTDDLPRILDECFTSFGMREQVRYGRGRELR